MARYYASTNNSNWGVFYDVTEGSYSIENNSSPVYVNVYLYRPNSNSYYGGTANISVTLDGSTQSATAYPSYPTNIYTGEANAHLMASFTFSVGHASDGSKSISFSLGWSANFNPTSASGSGSMTLTTIPRASEISSVSTANVGSNATISVNRKSSSFTHTITYSFGSLSGTVVTKSSNTSISWTIPTSFYAQIPNAKEGSGTLTITTYNGNSQVGSSSSKSFKVTTDSNACKPTVDGSVIDSNSTTTALTQNTSILIAGYSTAKVSYSATPKNSSSIKKVTVNSSVAYSGTSSSTVSGNKTISNFNASTITIEATDSRTTPDSTGYTNSKTLRAGTNYTLINYIPLTFSGSVSRQTPTGTVLLLSFSGNYFSGNLGATANTLSLVWKWRVKGSTTWETGGTLTLGTHYTINSSNNTYSSGSGSSQTSITLGSNFDYQTTYEIGIFYEDKLERNKSVVIDGLKGIPIANWTGSFFNINGEIKQYSKPYRSCCKMRTNFSYKEITSDGTRLTGWERVFQYGTITVNTSSSRIEVTNTSCLRLSGQICGYGNTWVKYLIYEKNGNSETEIDDSGMGSLYQLGRIGNGYWAAPLPNVLISLDRTKTYYVYLSVSPYNGYTMEVNNGFGSRGTYICAEKVY